MSEEQFFQSALDDGPADAAARLLMAEWLERRGDGRAAGYCWLARQAKYPYFATTSWDWWSPVSQNPDSIRLPAALWQALPPRPPANYPRCKEFPSRHEAEEAVIRALNDTA